jgi:N-acetylneuraminate synthase/N,N'-diacetyllegionaminate synthase
MDALREAFGLPAGFSDHTPGLETACAAVARGAAVLEKHLTLDKSLPGPDHKASLEPAEFKALVEAVRRVEAMLGDGVKRPAPCEAGNRAVARRSLVAARALPAGHVLAAADLLAKRPGTGIPPDRAPSLVGRRLKRGVAADEPLSWEALA